MDSFRMDSNESLAVLDSARDERALNEVAYSAGNVVVGERARRIASLRELIGVTEGYRSRECYPFSWAEPGIPRGAITEVSGPGKTAWVTQFLVENPALKVAWIEEDFSAYPYALHQARAGLDRILFIESGKDSHWAVSQALRSQVFGVVLFSSTTTTTRSGTGQEPFSGLFQDERTLRSLQLAAEKSRAAMIFLSDRPRESGKDSWPVSLQVQVSRVHPGRAFVLRSAEEMESGLRIRILKRRF